MTGIVHDAVKGNVGIVCKIAMGASPSVEYDGDVKKIELNPTDKDDSDLTFAEAMAGDTKDYTAKITALFSTAAGSFWRLLWDNPGATFSVVYGPHGNATPTSDKPHFMFTMKANGKPSTEQEAARSKTRANFDYEAEITSGPTLVLI